MRWLRSSRGVTSVVALLLTAVTLTGCGGGPPSGPARAGTKTGTFGGVEVIGYLMKLDSQADAWEVWDIKPSPSSVVQPKVLARLRPGSVDVPGIGVLAGRYIWAAGRRTGSGDGVPEIRVDGIDVAQEP